MAKAVEKSLPLAGCHVLWGTCWFNETAEQVGKVLASIGATLEKAGATASLAVFDANHTRASSEYRALKDLVRCKVWPNKVNAYPNKNHGVALLAELALRIGADIVTVVDPDWAFADLNRFVVGLVGPIATRAADAVIPNISNWAGRDNRLIGQPAMDVLYPGMRDAIPTPFPGALASAPEHLVNITRATSYHFDWGGEWNITFGLWRTGLRLASPNLGMVGVRHRPILSKTADAFQIWRAILSEPSLLPPPSGGLLPTSSPLSLALQGNATDQLREVRALQAESRLTATQSLLIPMVLAPLALHLDGTDTRSLPHSADMTGDPYDRQELDQVALAASLAVAEATRNRSCATLPTFEPGGVLGTWTTEAQSEVRNQLVSARMVDSGQWI